MLFINNNPYLCCSNSSEHIFPNIICFVMHSSNSHQNDSTNADLFIALSIKINNFIFLLKNYNDFCNISVKVNYKTNNNNDITSKIY
jgi:hypothetical protein